MKKNKFLIWFSVILCIAVFVTVGWLYSKMDNTGRIGTNNTDSGESTNTLPAEITGPVFVPQTDGPVFFGVKSSISVDCVDRNFILNEIKDKLFYMNIPERDYEVSEQEDSLTVVKISIAADKTEFEKLYSEMLNVVYTGSTSQHLVDGESVDKDEMNTGKEGSFLTINLYNKQLP